MKVSTSFIASLNRIVDELDDCVHLSTQDFQYFFDDVTYKHYDFFKLKKKSGGFRQISIPQEVLDDLLKPIKVYLEQRFIPSKQVHGYVQGRSIVTNAINHSNKTYVYNIDIKDFFASINKEKIFNSLINAPLGLNKEDAEVISFISTLSYYGKDKNGYFGLVSELPQGARTSPVLSNIACYALDNKLTELAVKYNLDYSRYADDITFSSDRNVFNDSSQFVKSLHSILNDEGFQINPRKTRLQPSWRHQEVTGVVINESPNVSRHFVKEIRSILHIWENYGIKDAIIAFYDNHPVKNKRCFNVKFFKCLILGKLMFLRMVKGSENDMVINLLNRFNKLCKKNKAHFYNKKIVATQEIPTPTGSLYLEPSVSSVKIEPPKDYEIRYLFFDTETTGLPKNYNAPSSDIENWPRLVQLSWIITDSVGNVLDKSNYIVYPKDFIIPESASDIHGITNEIAEEEGFNIDKVLDSFIKDFNKCDYIVGHNVNFDKKVLGAEMIRNNRHDIMNSKESICTMKSSIDYCDLVTASGALKYPKLEELYYILFEEELENAHDASCDVQATMECFWELKRIEIIE